MVPFSREFKGLVVSGPESSSRVTGRLTACVLLTAWATWCPRPAVGGNTPVHEGVMQLLGRRRGDGRSATSADVRGPLLRHLGLGPMGRVVCHGFLSRGRWNLETLRSESEMLTHPPERSPPPLWCAKKSAFLKGVLGGFCTLLFFRGCFQAHHSLRESSLDIGGPVWTPVDRLTRRTFSGEAKDNFFRWRDAWDAFRAFSKAAERFETVQEQPRDHSKALRPQGGHGPGSL